MAEALDWIDPDGVRWPLTGGSQGIDVLWGLQGRFAPKVRLIEDQVPGQDGARLRAAHHEPREIVVPVLVRADDPAELRTRLRAWLSHLNVHRGPGRLRSTGPAGDQREITCIYTGGLEISEAMGERYASGKAQKAAVVFRAHDPYWYDVAATTQVWIGPTSTQTWFPFFPLSVAADNVFGEVSVGNPGDVDAWPVWTIRGPGSDIVLTNLTTGKALTLETTLAGGQSVVIDTRPGAKTVTRDDTTNLFPSLTADSALWSLEPGDNEVRIEMVGATGDSRVEMSRRHAYLSC